MSDYDPLDLRQPTPLKDVETTTSDTVGRRRMLHYFWTEKGDVERFNDYKVALLENPEVYRAWCKYRRAVKRMDREIDALELGDD